jgi:hypothetical protein
MKKIVLIMACYSFSLNALTISNRTTDRVVVSLFKGCELPKTVQKDSKGMIKLSNSDKWQADGAAILQRDYKLSIENNRLKVFNANGKEIRRATRLNPTSQWNILVTKLLPPGYLHEIERGAVAASCAPPTSSFTCVNKDSTYSISQGTSASGNCKKYSLKKE